MDRLGKRAVNFGGNWNNGVNSGSRSSNWNNAASNSNNNIGSRFVCDGIITYALAMLRLVRPTNQRVVSQFYPPSGNTLLGSA